LRRNIIGIVDFAPDFEFVVCGNRTHENIGYKYFGSFFYENFLIYSRTGRAVVPARFCVVVSGSCRGIHLIAFEPQRIPDGTLIPSVNVVVFYGYRKDIFSAFDIRRYVEFERREKSFMRSDKSSVYMNFRYIIHSVEMKK